ncbi:hypothetical protein [Dethiosulfatarculus sandiegensis]|uniref:Uncharacterized protein n=1 Tax=Dethiosulfatarculus sandiegensis TaxID=1429043 RepID=A0A0D2JYW8_9BACT|nr:hypothetical protein [Dethiosulfatarculus sandiegensis]KIX14755.1 hypothetical protein X474_06330 [Dethiosulfatarculus sandiegensis]
MVYQHTHANPHKVVVHLMQGLRPGIIPYPMLGNHKPARLCKIQPRPLCNLSQGAGIADIVISHSVNETINGTIRRMAARCGQIMDLVDDNQCPDDIIGLIVNGRNLGNTPAGHKPHFKVSGLSRGQHQIAIIAVNSGGKRCKCRIDDIVSFSVTLGKGVKFQSGGAQKTGRIKAGAKKSYKVIVQ